MHIKSSSAETGTEICSKLVLNCSDSKHPGRVSTATNTTYFYFYLDVEICNICCSLQVWCSVQLFGGE